jgi:hypothetical protein
LPAGGVVFEVADAQFEIDGVVQPPQQVIRGF